MPGENAVFPRPFVSETRYDHLNSIMRAEDLVRLDVGCEWDHYQGDLGRTIPVSGRFTQDQRETWSIFVAAYHAGSTALREGVTVDQVFDAWRTDLMSHKSAAKTPLAQHAIGHPHECPGPVSARSEIMTGGRLETTNGLKFTIEDQDVDYLLWYFNTKVRKTGVAGEMILSITADADGRVKKVSVVKSLSPALDKVTVKSARKWKFKLIKGNANSGPGEFELPVTFTAVCEPDW
jgi:TonB family protein